MSINLFVFRADRPLPEGWDVAVSEEEQARAAKLRDVEKQRQFLATRIVGRRLLGGMLGCDPAEVSWSVKGAPIIATPGMPALRASVSHSGPYSLLAFSAESPSLGVDIECFLPPMDPEAVMRGAFSLREREALTQLPADRQEAVFRRMWVIKEAAWKLLSTRISTDSPSELVDPFVEVLPECVGTDPQDCRWRLEYPPLLQTGPNFGMSILEFHVTHDAARNLPSVAPGIPGMQSAQDLPTAASIAWGALAIAHEEPDIEVSQWSLGTETPQQMALANELRKAGIPLDCGTVVNSKTEA